MNCRLKVLDGIDVQNDPVNFVDPTGKIAEIVVPIIISIPIVIWIATHPPKPIHIDWPDDSGDDWRSSGIQDTPGFEDYWPPPDPNNCSEEDRCKQAKEDCLKECLYILERPPRWPGDDSNTFDHATCIAECMERKNC